MSDIELPAFLEDEDEETILQRMLDLIPDDIDKSEGSYIWDSLMPVAIEVAKTGEWARMVLERGFTSTTYGNYLDLKASEKGLERQDAVKSFGSATFYGTAGTIIPIGTRISTLSDNVTPPIEFETTEQGTIPEEGSVVIPIEAVIAGESGNVKKGAISIILNDISGVISVINQHATYGGFDEESDERLRDRVLAENKRADGAGNIDDYISWSQEVPSVGNVVVEPIWDGINTVRVIVFDRNGDSASQQLIKQVQDYLDPTKDGGGHGKAPIGAIVTVGTVSKVNVDVSIQGLQIEDDYKLEQLKEDITKSLVTYLETIDVGGTIMLKAVSAAIIQTEGVFDFADVTLNGNKENIPITNTQVPSLGSVTYL
ncbi:baseplate J/gp47 family protein [Virgibacillus sp. FSP13]